MTDYDQIVRAINRFDRAVRDHEMKGAQHPDDHDKIVLTYTRAKEKLLHLLRDLRAADGAR